MTRRPILPPLRRTAADAERFARAVHADQRDKAGRPYVEHLERVVERSAILAAEASNGDDGFLDQLAQIAWLHDVLEDTDTTAVGLLLKGYSPYVIGCIGWLTKTGGEPYETWISSLCQRAPLSSRLVKIADIEDNSDPIRLALLPTETRARLERKYGPALVRLHAAVEGMGSKPEISGV